MRSTDERFFAIQNRVNEIEAKKKQRRNRLILIVSTSICLVSLIGLALGMPRLTTDLTGSEYGTTESLGSVFIQSDKIDYVLIALLAFWLGVGVTVLSVHLRKLPEDEERNHHNV